MFNLRFTPSANEKATRLGGFFRWRIRKRFEHERPREGRTRPPPVADKGSVRSEQIRSSLVCMAHEQSDYICDVRRREAARFFRFYTRLGGHVFCC